MEAALIERIVGFGPWVALVALGMVLLRKELGQILLSSRADGEAENAMRQMNAQFAENLKLFVQSTKDTAKMVELLGDIKTTLGNIHSEQLRGGRRLWHLMRRERRCE